MTRPARPEDVDEICAALPITELGTSGGDVPTWKVPTGDKGKGFVLYRPPHSSAVDPVSGEQYDDLLVIRTADAGDKAALVEDDSPFCTVDHFCNFNAVLVRQARLGELSLAELTELTEVIQDAWLAVAPKRLGKEFLADG